MNASLAVVTAIYDAYDTPKLIAPQRGLDVDWVLVTDDPDLDVPSGWRVIVEPRPDLHPNRAAKQPKLFPWRYTSAAASVWIDASFQITSSDFVRDALTIADPIAQFEHPWRDCIYDEAYECSLIQHKAKYGAQRASIDAQVAQYRADGHPEHWGLWATGVIARWHTAETRALSWLWAAQIHRFSYQDQVSQAVVLRQMGLRPNPLTGTHFANPWVEYHDSNRHHVG